MACEDLALATWRAVRLGGTGAVGRAGRRLGGGVTVALTEGRLGTAEESALDHHLGEGKGR